MLQNIVTYVCLLLLAGGAEGKSAVSGMRSKSDNQEVDAKAAELVRRVRESENWIHGVDSLWIRGQGKTIKSPKGAAAARAKGLGSKAGTFPFSLEIAFDKQRIYFRRDVPGRRNWLYVWDGEQSIYVCHNETAKPKPELSYSFGPNPDDIFGGELFTYLSWQIRSLPTLFQ